MTVERVGYVGLDHHHRDPYLESLAQLPVEVMAVCEPDPSYDVDAINSLQEVRQYGDAETLIADADVDALWVTLPNRDTPEVIRAAADADVHVYTEKPAARRAGELQPVVDAVESSEATVCLSYTWRWHPLAEELKARFERGYFGDLLSFDARFVASALEYRDADHYLYDADASRGGIVQWLGVHWLDLLSWLLGNDRIARVNASLSSSSPDVDVEDGATITLETASGAVGSLQCGYYLREGRYDTRIDLYGTDAKSSCDPMGPTFGFDGETTLELDSRREADASTPSRSITHSYDPCPGYGGRWGLEFIEDFLDACDGKRPVPVDVHDGVRVLELLDAVYESAETDRWVPVDSGGSRPGSPDTERTESVTD